MVACLRRLLAFVYIMVDGLDFSWTSNLSILSFSISYVTRVTNYTGVGCRKCGAFLSILVRIPTQLVLGVGESVHH